jgi:hypothetical protein
VPTNFAGFTTTEILNLYSSQTQAQRGLLIYNTTTAYTGKWIWQYSTNAGSTWNTITLGNDQAVYIKEYETGSAIPNRLRIYNNSYSAYDETNATFSVTMVFNAWDLRSGETTGTLATYSTIPKGDESSVGTSAAQFQVNITRVKTPPIVSTGTSKTITL